MITSEHVKLKYPDGTEALKGLDFFVDKGELIYITGPSGSGKTSLIKLLLGAERPSSGQLKVLGHDMVTENQKGVRDLRQQIGPVFQELKLINGRSALDNVMLGMRFLDIPRNQWKQKATEALDRVRLGHKVFSKAENLSWGERQRVAIARAITRKPSLILADEPTGNLDAENAVNILQILDSLRDEQTSVIITTHATHLINQAATTQLFHIENGLMHINGGPRP